MIHIGNRVHRCALVLSSAVFATASLSAMASAGTVVLNCNIPQPCALDKNANGYGLEGSSAKSAGLYGTSTTSNGVLGNTAGRSGQSAAVKGADLATNDGINDGVLGTVTNGGWGVQGTSGNGAFGGVQGSATEGTGVEGTSASGTGVFGDSSSQTGVFGASSSAAGIYGTSGSGFGVEGYTSTNDAGHFVNTGAGTGMAAISGTGDAIYASTGGSVGAYVRNSNGNATDVQGTYISLLGRGDTFPLALFNSSAGDLFWVTGTGAAFAESYNTFTAVRRGTVATAYTTKTTTPNVEDVGNAQLVNGVAVVKLDPAFAASIDMQSVYHVFLTPGGDTRGLYVASKTPAGFVVRETQGGRGTLSFDYRIVASVLGHARDRMALVSESAVARPDGTLVPRLESAGQRPLSPAELIRKQMTRKAH